MFAFRFRNPLLSSCALALSVCCSSTVHAQQPLQASASTTLPSDSVAWTPQGLSALSQRATSHTDFTFDRSILGLVGNMSTLDAPTRQTIARLNGIALHLYRFPEHAGYDLAAIAAIRAQYDAFGWKHFSTTHPERDLSGEAAGHTDVWLNTHGVNVAGAVILLSGPTTVNLIAVSGDLSTLDLLRLRGHFGIPEFPADALPH